MKAKRKEKIIKIANDTQEIELDLIRKQLGTNKKEFVQKFPKIAQDFGFSIESGKLLVPSEKNSNFLDALEKKFKKGKSNQTISKTETIKETQNNE